MNSERKAEELTWSDLLRRVEPQFPLAEYVEHVSEEIGSNTPIWTNDTRNIFCYAFKGGSEGWYTRTDVIRIDKQGRYTCESAMLVKVWSLDEALHAVDTITRLIYQWADPR